MKRFWARLWRSVGFWLALVIVLQTAVYVVAGVKKAYIHMDEAYSLGLAQYDQVEITSKPDFYNHWHSKEYFQDYLAVQEEERGDFVPVYENQKNDVHPPLFYLLLRIFMEMAPGEFSKWPGIILNILLAIPNTILTFMILKKLLTGKGKEVKALILTAAVGLTVAGISMVVYIRMYMLLTLMVTLTIWLHLKLWQSKKVDFRLLTGIGVTTLLGVLTQYYYLFFLVPLWVVLAVKYAREKRWKELGAYTAALGIAGVVSLLIWPYSIQHMFFGYRGQGVLASLFNVPQLVGNIWRYILVLDYNGFHRILLAWLVLGVVVLVLRASATNGEQSERGSPVTNLVGVRVKEEFTLPSEATPENLNEVKMGRAEVSRKSSTTATNGNVWQVILWPTLAYFLIVAAVSPFIELRYIMPVCAWLVILVIVGVYKAVRRVWTEKVSNLVVGGMIALTLVAAPIQLSQGWMRVELLYRDRQAVMNLVGKAPGAPILYFITTENNRFLDNILPFAEAKESYLALDLLEPTVGEVKQILEGKNLEEGLIVFVSGSQDQEKALAAVKAATGLEKVDLIQGINTCDVYYLQ